MQVEREEIEVERLHLLNVLAVNRPHCVLSLSLAAGPPVVIVIDYVENLKLVFSQKKAGASHKVEYLVVGDHSLGEDEVDDKVEQQG